MIIGQLVDHIKIEINLFLNQIIVPNNHKTIEATIVEFKDLDLEVVIHFSFAHYS